MEKTSNYRIVTMQEFDQFRQIILMETILNLEENNLYDSIDNLIKRANGLFLIHNELDSITVAGQVLLSTSIILEGLKNGKFEPLNDFFYLDKSQTGQTFVKLNQEEKIEWHLSRIEWSMMPLKGFKNHLNALKEAIFNPKNIDPEDQRSDQFYQSKILKRYIISWLLLDDNCLDTAPRMFSSLTVKQVEENSTLVLA